MSYSIQELMDLIEEGNKKKLEKKLKRWRNAIVKYSISYNWNTTDEEAYNQIQILIAWWEAEIEKYINRGQKT